MNKKVIGSFLLIAAMAVSCQNMKKADSPVKSNADSAKIINDNLRFCEATCWDGNTLYVSNFGGDTLNSLNRKGKGYIMKFNNSKPSILIPADGRLSAPKGMCIVNGYLFVADVNAVVAFNLKDVSKSQKISFPVKDIFVNDIAAKGNDIYVTVTNTGNIYKLDVTNPDKMQGQVPKLFANVPGANGIVTTDSIFYVASYPTDGNTTAKNVIYTITNFEKPVISKLFDRMSQYDGLALSEDGQTLYFSTWVNGNVGKIDLKTMKTEMLTLPLELNGPADISMHKGKLYIPDLPNSNILVY